MNRIQSCFDRYSGFLGLLLPVLTFCLPLGPSPKSIAVVLSLLGILCFSQTRKTLLTLCTQPLIWIVLTLFVISILGSFWSVAPLHQKWAVIGKYSKLLFIPIFAAGFSQPNTRFYSIQAYLLGILVTCCTYFYIYYSGPEFSSNGYLSDQGYVFYNHIVTSYMIAFASYLAAWSAVQTHNRWCKIGYIILVFIFSIEIFTLSASRTGYLMYGLLFLLFSAQHFSLKAVRSTILIFLISFLILFQYTHSLTLMNRIKLVSQDIHAYQSGQKNTSIGFRLQFHHYAKSLFLEKPLLGQGTGGFAYRFSQDQPMTEWDAQHPDAHSQYWHTTSELGLLGLSALLFLLISLVKQSFRLNEMKPILQAVILPFTVVCYSDTALLTGGIGYVFVIFSSLCLGEWSKTLLPHFSDHQALSLQGVG